MRIYLIKQFSGEAWRQVLPVNNWYEGELSPTAYDSKTLQPASPTYIVLCNDGEFRTIDAEYFLKKEEWRERQLNQIFSLSL